MECVGGKWKYRQFRLDVPPGDLAQLVVVQERLHRGHPNLSQFLDRPNSFAPDELVSIAPRLIDDLVVGRCNPFLNLRLFESIDWITGHDPTSSLGGFSVEAGGA